MIIYKITNINNGDFYIGQTINDFKTRWYNHLKSAFKKNSMTHFHCAIRMYGEDAFSNEIIATASSKDELNQLEYDLIKKLKPRYNSKDGGTGGKQSPEVIKKISNTLKGRPNGRKGLPGPKLSEQAKEKLRLHFTGKSRKPFTEEARKNMSLAKMGNKNAKRKE